MTGGSPDYPVNHPPPVLHITPLKFKKLPWKPKAGISLGLKRQEPAFAQHRINAFLCQKLSYPNQLSLFNFLERKEVCAGTTAGSEVDSAQGTLSILPKTQRKAPGPIPSPGYGGVKRVPRMLRLVLIISSLVRSAACPSLIHPAIIF